MSDGRLACTERGDYETKRLRLKNYGMLGCRVVKIS